MDGKNAKIHNARADIIEVSQETQKRKQKRHFEKITEEPTEFPESSYVLLRQDKETSKLHIINKGPYKVICNDLDNPNRYTVQNLVTLKLEDFLNGYLLPFITDPSGPSPEEAALVHDNMEIVDKWSHIIRQE